MSPPLQFKDAVRASYDENASLYVTRRRMQDSNLSKLIRVLCEGAEQPIEGTLVDVGCADGVAFPLLAASACFRGTYVGVDLSAQFIARARETYPTARFLVGDAESLALGSSSAHVVFSNSVIHWLNVPEEGRDPGPALQEFARVLRPGGTLVASIAGAGTASRFLLAYRRVMASLALQSSPAYRADPIGSMRLDRVVSLVGAAGFAGTEARMVYEPVRYESALDYQEDVRAYGYQAFLAAVPVAEREAAWRAIGEEFVRVVGTGEYVHDQYMIYLRALCEKPSGAE